MIVMITARQTKFLVYLSAHIHLIDSGHVIRHLDQAVCSHQNMAISRPLKIKDTRNI